MAGTKKLSSSWTETSGCCGAREVPGTTRSTISSITGNPTLFERSVSTFAADIESHRFARYYSGFQVPCGRRKLDSPWGWKDPRTLFVFDVWKEIFPGMKIIYITRNVADVAASLKHRSEKNLLAGQGDILHSFDTRKRIKNFFLRNETFSLGSSNCCDINYCCNLWESYVSKGEEVYDGYEGDKIRLRFEDFLASPGDALRDLAAFCELKVGSERLRSAAASLRRDRAWSFTRDETLLSLHAEWKNHPLMKKLGYAGEIVVAPER